MRCMTLLSFCYGCTCQLLFQGLTLRHKWFSEMEDLTFIDATASTMKSGTIPREPPALCPTTILKHFKYFKKSKPILKILKKIVEDRYRYGTLTHQNLEPNST